MIECSLCCERRAVAAARSATSASHMDSLTKLPSSSMLGQGSLSHDVLRGNGVGHRYGFDASGKLPAQPTVQAKDLVGVFNNRASNPVIQAAAADSTEAILWEVSPNMSVEGQL